MAETKTVHDWLINEVSYLLNQQKGYIDALSDHAKKTDDEDLKKHVLRFRADHELHRDRLQKYLDTLKGGRSFGLGEALGMSLGGGKAIIDSARDTDYASLFRECLMEQTMIGAYETLLEAVDSLGEPELERICRENLEDERQHLEYMKGCFKERMMALVAGTAPHFKGAERYGTEEPHKQEEPPTGGEPPEGQRIA